MSASRFHHKFLSQFRRRLFLRNALKTLFWTLLAGGILALIYAISWRLEGRAIPPQGYFVILFWALVIGACWTFLRHLSQTEAAQAADTEYQLKDGLISSLKFEEEKRTGEVYDLQKKKLEEQLKNHSPQTLSLRIPWRVAASATGLITLLIWLATLPNSEAVEKQIQHEQLTLDHSAEVKAAMEEIMEELLKELDEDELAEIDAEEMKDWLKGLEETKDQKEALRQLARFEQKLANTLKGLEAREDEETLKLAAAELAKSDLSDARQLGKKLEKKEFKEAGLDIENLKPGDKDPQGRKLSNEERKNMMKKLREATKRMANGAKNKNKNLKPRNAKARDAKKLQPLDELLDELDEAAAELDEQLQNMEEFDGEIEEGDFDEKMKNFAGRMKKLDARKKLRGKLKRMRSQVGKSQSFMAAGGAQQLGLANKGGLPPGKGSQESNRKGETEMPPEMAAEHLKGQKGQGPSQSTVEDADSGTGISGKRSDAKARDFNRQMESFVQRDDVPEEMKLGVREYFERIHKVENEETPSP